MPPRARVHGKRKRKRLSEGSNVGSSPSSHNSVSSEQVPDNKIMYEEVTVNDDVNAALVAINANIMKNTRILEILHAQLQEKKRADIQLSVEAVKDKLRQVLCDTYFMSVCLSWIHI